MQNIIQKFRQSSIVFEKPGILPENFKTILQFNIFCLNFAHIFYLPMSTKECVGFFISFRSRVICKDFKRPSFYTLVFYTFINNSRSKQNKNNPTHPFVDITK